MTEQTHFEIPLFDVGVKGARFRVENVGGELQRPVLDQHKTSDIQYRADLVAVVHGTMTPGGQRGVILAIDFHFISNPQQRRFKRVDISVAFGREDAPIGGAKEPVVEQMAPHGTFGMDEATQNRVDTLEMHGSAEGGLSLATLGIGSSYQRTTTVDTKTHAILHGTPWIEVRNSGRNNAAQWKIEENVTRKSGVPPQLRAAILLSLPDEGKFRAELSLTAKIGTFHSKLKRRVGANTGLQPVYFDPSPTTRIDLGPPLSDVDKTHLAACNLAQIGTAKEIAIITPATASA
ncbi:hypothetical protein N658DRAFT_511736 [Parathielavia hyrcaniae]|uniref:Uncharacterized protein n=1 Tax=Parathielavia hyrcaniae TaxID=113614 RepID=A0AAN6PQD9_9PEZI|nr:hypothetical protein N658DRAFT_511736 [Parathielavia hyrcaniae]